MQGKYKKLIEECASLQAEWWLAQLYDNTEWVLDGENIDDDDFNAVHSAVMQRTIELLTD
jgi:hypothetical protein